MIDGPTAVSEDKVAKRLVAIKVALETTKEEHRLMNARKVRRWFERYWLAIPPALAPLVWMSLPPKSTLCLKCGTAPHRS
jgi:hypothetical protein